MKLHRRHYIIFVAAFLAICVIGLYFVAPAFFFTFAINRTIKDKERAVLYHINHKALATVAREFAWPLNSQSLKERFPDPYFEKGDSRIPTELWIADPARILGYDDRIDFEYGGALLHFGISIFKPGLVGEGTLKLQDGVWFYSDTGRYPPK